MFSVPIHGNWSNLQNSLVGLLHGFYKSSLTYFQEISRRHLTKFQQDILCNRWYCHSRDVRPSACHTLLLYKKEQSQPHDLFSIEEQDILVSEDIRLISKFVRGHPERGRFLRLEMARTGDFGDSSTNHLHITETVQYMTKVAIDH